VQDTALGVCNKAKQSEWLSVKYCAVTPKMKGMVKQSNDSKAAAESFCLPLTHCGKVGHSKDGIDEHDQEEQEADVKQGRKGHHQGKEQRADPLGPFDQTQDSTNPGEPDHSEQERAHKQGEQQAKGEAGSPLSREPDAGLDPRTLGP